MIYSLYCFVDGYSAKKVICIILDVLTAYIGSKFTGNTHFWYLVIVIVNRILQLASVDIVTYLSLI